MHLGLVEITSVPGLRYGRLLTLRMTSVAHSYSLQGHYESGDVLFHTPYTVHAGAQNRSPSGRIRLSTDLRFVDKSQPYDKRWTVVAFSEGDENVAR